MWSVEVSVGDGDIEASTVDWQQRADESKAAKNKANDSIKDGG